MSNAQVYTLIQEILYGFYPVENFPGSQVLVHR